MTHDWGNRSGKAPLERTEALAQRPLALLTLGDLVRTVREVVREELALLRASEATAPPELEQPRQYLTVRDAARLCGVSEKTIRAWVREGKLPGRRIGRLLRIDRRDLEAYLAQRDGIPSANRLDVDALASNILARRTTK